MGEHTPGPYIVGEPGGPAGPFWSLVNSKGNVVALQIVSESDAHFLSAAPDLLEACEFALSQAVARWEQVGKHPSSHHINDVDLFQDAIRKAKGGS